MSQKSSAESDAKKLRERNRELLILNSFAEALSRSLDLEETIRVALTEVADLLHLRTGWVWLIDSESHQPYLASWLHLPPALRENPKLMEGSCFCLDTYEQGDLSGAANVNVVTCSRLKALVGGTDGLRYHASIPLYSGVKKLGVLNVASGDWRELSEDDLRILHTVGDFLSVAIERARLFAATVSASATEERIRIARELHDTLAQGLTAIALQLESADAALEMKVNVEEARTRISKALKMTRTSLDEARRSVLELRENPLERQTFAVALRELILSSKDQGNFQTDFEILGLDQTFPENIELGLFRVAQEALTNIIRHAQASRVQIRLNIAEDHVRLTIEDDGVGFDPALVPGDRFGLIGLNERLNLLGGKLSVLSEIKSGTKIVAHVPLGDSDRPADH